MMYYVAGTLIRNARFFKGLTAADLARQLDVSSAYISDVEHGRRKLTVKRTPVVEGFLQIPYGTLDVLYGRLPARIVSIVESDPAAAKSLANALSEWRMVNESGRA